MEFTKVQNGKENTSYDTHNPMLKKLYGNRGISGNNFFPGEMALIYNVLKQY